MHVCLSVCLFVCISARISETTRPNFTNFFCACYLWFGPSLTANGFVYVLLVLWMTSCFHIMERMGRIRDVADAYVSSSSLGGGTRAKSTISYCILFLFG